MPDILSQAQVADIIRKAPPGTSPAGIVASLRANGAQLEGYDQATPQEVAKPQKSLLGSAIDVGNKYVVPALQAALTPFNSPVVKDFGVGLAKSAVGSVVGASKLVDQGLTQTAGRVANAALGKGFTPTQTSVDKVIPNSISEPSNTTQKLGKVAGDVGQLFAPTALGGKVKALTGAASFLEKTGIAAEYIPKVAGVLSDALATGVLSASQSGGNVNQGVKDAALSAAIPAVFKVVGTLGGIGAAIATKAASRLSGVPTDAIERAYQNPNVVRSTITKMRSLGDGAISYIVDQAEAGLSNLKKIRSEVYKKNLAELEAISTGNKRTSLGTKVLPADTVSGLNVQKRDNIVSLGIKGLKDKVRSTLSNFNINSKSGNFADDAFAKSPFPKAINADIKEIVGRIYSWKDTSAVGLDDLREVIASYRKGGVNLSSGDKQFNKIVGELKNSVQNYMEQRVPESVKLNKSYHMQSAIIDDIMNTLSLGKDKPQVVAKKLLNIFSPQNPMYREAVSKLGKTAADNIMNDLSAVSMSKWLPDDKLSSMLASGAIGAGVLANPASWPALIGSFAMSSPGLVGEVATRAGKISPFMRNVAPALKEGARRITQVMNR